METEGRVERKEIQRSDKVINLKGPRTECGSADFWEYVEDDELKFEEKGFKTKSYKEYMETETKVETRECIEEEIQFERKKSTNTTRLLLTVRDLESRLRKESMTKLRTDTSNVNQGLVLT